MVVIYQSFPFTIPFTDFSSTSSSETPLVADPPKNLVQTGNADFQSPNYFHTTIPVKSTFRSQMHRLLALVNRSPTVDRAENKNINCRTVQLMFLFSCAGPLVWNTLPDSVVYCDKFRGFKRKLKTHLTGLAAN